MIILNNISINEYAWYWSSCEEKSANVKIRCKSWQKSSNIPRIVMGNPTSNGHNPWKYIWPASVTAFYMSKACSRVLYNNIVKATGISLWGNLVLPQMWHAEFTNSRHNTSITLDREAFKLGPGCLQLLNRHLMFFCPFCLGRLSPELYLDILLEFLK